MRCLTLANEFQARGGVCHFICRTHTGNLNQLIRDYGHIVHELSIEPETASYNDVGAPPHINWLGGSRKSDALASLELIQRLSPDVLIVDHYALDAVWESVVRSCCNLLVVIDDLADRPHLCDLLIDQNLGRLPSDYAKLVPRECKILCGPGYALLRSEFSRLRSFSLARRHSGKLRSITISMGGVDAPDASSKVLEALARSTLAPDTTIKVIMGATAPAIANVRLAAARLPWKTEVLVGVKNVGEILADTDLVIGAAGGSAWERCTLGVPTIIVVLAENQRAGAIELAAQGAAILLGDVEQIEVRMVEVLDTLSKGDKLLELSHAAARLTDGNGALRVREAIASRFE